MSYRNVLYIVLLVLIVLESAIYQIKDRKKRYILLSILGVALMGTIFGFSIYLKATKVTIFMGVLLIGYIVSLTYIWIKWVRKQDGRE